MLSDRQGVVALVAANAVVVFFGMAWSPGVAYGFYTVCAPLSFFFVLRWVPETKGRKLEDMD